MSNTVIKVEDVGKLYKLGEIGTGTISHDLNRWFARVRGKEDPFAKIGQVNDRAKKSDSDYVWALKDINFEVKQGEVLGIIGRNGAGKSTLLKILSKVTTPSTGRIKVKGRIASLLEVGTGFHPELTGRENIYLNGAILGMTKREIRSKFDEIVDFAGVERYIDTPVKRYSSGMYVRLAFAVAAFLEPEILIVDEVLAVGDAEFQKKCLGRMKDVSVNDGRTVLFVSHNMTAMKNLCEKGILLKYGNVVTFGSIQNTIQIYHNDEKVKDGKRIIDSSTKLAHFEDWYLENATDENSNYTREVFNIIFSLNVQSPIKNVELGLIIRDLNGEIVYGCNSRDGKGKFINLSKGLYEIKFEIRLPLRPDNYELDIAIVSDEGILDNWSPQKKLRILDRFDTVIEHKWAGILSELPVVTYDKVS